MGSGHWPLFDLRLRTERLELRPASDDDLFGLAAAAAAGIHEPGEMPFNLPWSEQPPGTLERGVLQHGWSVRARWTVTSWNVPLAVVALDGQVIGSQNVMSSDFTVTRQVATGSWLTRAHQGRGLGREMRAAALAFAFEGLAATHCTTAAFEDNPASLGVTRSLGYEADGWSVHPRKGSPVRLLRFRIDRENWSAHRRHEVAIDGLDACLPMFGLGPDLEPLPDPRDPMV